MYNYFNGTTLPSPENIHKLADFFRVTPEEIDPRFSETPALLSATPINHTEQHNNLEQINAALACLKSFDGKPVTEHDHKILSEIIVTYLKNR